MSRKSEPKSGRAVKSKAKGKTTANAARKVWELENILASVAAPMFVTDPNLIIQRINDAALKASGWSREEVVGRMTCAELAKTPLCGTSNCTIKNCMRTGEAIIGETVMETRDGKKIPIAASCSAVFDEDGNPLGGIEVILSQAEQKETLAEVGRLIDSAIENKWRRPIANAQVNGIIINNSASELS